MPHARTRATAPCADEQHQLHVHRWGEVRTVAGHQAGRQLDMGFAAGFLTRYSGAPGTVRARQAVDQHRVPIDESPSGHRGIDPFEQRLEEDQCLARRPVLVAKQRVCVNIIAAREREREEERRANPCERQIVPRS